MENKLRKIQLSYRQICLLQTTVISYIDSTVKSLENVVKLSELVELYEKLDLYLPLDDDDIEEVDYKEIIEPKLSVSVEEAEIIEETEQKFFNLKQ